MKNAINKKKQEGFTIIEVLIVLAIAGLIILIVFLAIPALQRNSRNTQRRADSSAVLGALSEYINNNNGQLPPDKAAFINNAKLGFYTQGDILYNNSSSKITTVPTGETAENSITVNAFSKCGSAENGEAPHGYSDNATRRNVTGIFYVETSGAPQVQCQDM